MRWYCEWLPAHLVWDGEVGTSIAGLQGKLMVYVDQPLDDGGRLFLVEPGHQMTPHLVVNEHCCMYLARRIKLPFAEVSIYRTPSPVLVGGGYDQAVLAGAQGPTVQRLHIIDACQASDRHAAYKYERNFRCAEHVHNIREGVSFAVLFDRVEQTVNKAAAPRGVLTWA